ncbi:hypothetical protein HII31_10778 [Pseudocercospora fuligena]|uniref:Uncharacterized protein n=1 Tax=Pseudocercospora fuligena TaxID=685502 RepID=A0A8H6RB64_9PEZI|nr:hypothetical protein HII31_10778 [Pseudocercospora fuligena]
MSHFHIAKAIVAFYGITGAAAAAFQNSTGTSSTSTSSTDMGSIILQGLGGSTESSTTLSTSSTSTDSSSSILSSTITSSSATITATTSSNSTSTSPNGIVVPDAHVQWSTGLFRDEYVNHARSCWSAYTSWYASYPAYYETTNATVITTETITTQPGQPFPFSQTFWPEGSVPTYKECDGTPRATFSPSTTFYSTSISMTGTSYVTLSPSVPPQACTMNQEDCAVAYYGANIKSMPYDDSPQGFAHLRLLGGCGDTFDRDLGCLVQGGPVQLYYFPVTTKGGLCDANGTTVTQTEEQAPVTTMGTTFQPGSVYLSFSTLYAAYRRFTAPGGEAVQVGPTFKNTIFAFKSDEISTNCYVSTFGDQSSATGPGYGPGTQLNYADLNSPVPASAYQCQNQCKPSSTWIGTDGNYSSTAIIPNPCNTIFDNFNPLLAMPTRLRDMVPEWSSCGFWDYQRANIVFDPPTALQQVASAALPTLPTKLTSTAASPAPTQPPVASATASATQGAPTVPTVGNGGSSAPAAAPSSSAQEDNLPTTAQQPASSVPSAPSPVLGSSQQSLNAPEAGTTVAFTPVAGQSTSANGAQSPAQTTAQQGGTALPVSEGQSPATTIQFSQAGTDQPVAPSQQPGNSISDAQSPAIITLDGTTLTASQATAGVVIDGTTISNGQAATINGATFSVGPSGVVVNPSSAAETLAAGSVTIVASSMISGEAVIDGTTLSVGGSAVTISGEVVSMASGGLVGIQPGATASDSAESSGILHPSPSHSQTSTMPEQQQGSGASAGMGIHLSGLVFTAVAVTVVRHFLMA